MALGIIIAAVGLGAGSGPLIGGQLIDEFGWRSIYVAVAPLAVLTVMLSYFLLRREERLPIANFDIMGSTLGFVGLGSLLVALNRTSDWGATSPGIIGLATLGMVLMAAFVWREGRVFKPVLDLAIFRSKAVVVSSMGLVLQVMGNSTTTLVLPFFLVRSLELSSTASGALFAIAPGFMLAGGLVGGKLSARLGVGPVMLAGMVAQVIGVGLLLFIDENASILHIALALVIMGSGAGMYQTSAGSAQMNAIPPGHIGTASALFIAVIMMAGSTGATLGGILMSSGDSSVIRISQVADNYHTVAIAGTTLLLLGLLNALYYQFRIVGRRTAPASS
jgi:DHA2 family methylenomycin A resistance protein-like MFS transporter